MAGEFPEDVRRFLIDYITSVDEVETLLLLQADPKKEWTSTVLGRELGTPSSVAVARLETLRAIGLIAMTEGITPTYRYSPRSAELEEKAARLLETYRERRSAVISIIYSKPLRQVQAFAEAFRFWKGK